MVIEWKKKPPSNDWLHNTKCPSFLKLTLDFIGKKTQKKERRCGNVKSNNTAENTRNKTMSRNLKMSKIEWFTIKRQTKGQIGQRNMPCRERQTDVQACKMVFSNTHPIDLQNFYPYALVLYFLLKRVHNYAAASNFYDNMPCRMYVTNKNWIMYVYVL